MLSAKRMVFVAVLSMGLGLLSSAGSSATTLSMANLPPDFAPRFIAACMRRGLTEARCACMTDVVLREVADEHLALMIDYFENPTGFDARAMQELNNDENRMRVLEEEIDSAQSAARNACARN